MLTETLKEAPFLSIQRIQTALILAAAQTLLDHFDPLRRFLSEINYSTTPPDPSLPQDLPLLRLLVLYNPFVHITAIGPYGK